MRLLLIASLLAVTVLAQAQEHDDFTEALDDTLHIAAYAMPAVRLLSDDPEKRETGRRLADAVIIETAVATLLKETIHSSRPSGGDDGFPSNHAALAFAVATSLYEREPSSGWIAFPLAAAAAWARVDLEEHTWWQVIGGAAIGAFIGHQCGEGKWRVLGRGDEAAAVGAPASSRQPLVSDGFAGWKPALLRPTLWRVTF